MPSFLPAPTKNAMISGGFPPATEFYFGFASPTWTPSGAGPGADEITGTSANKRQGSDLGTPSTGVERTTTAMTFPNMPACTLKYWIANAAATGAGTYKGGGPTTTTIDVPEGATVACAIGAFTLEIQG